MPTEDLTKPKARYDYRRAAANFGYNAPFLFAVAPYTPWNVVSLVAFVCVVATYLYRCRTLPEWGVGSTAGFTAAMWIVRVAGYEDARRPNIGLAILLVAAQVIVVLVAESLKRWRAERLTPPPAGS